MEKIVEALSGMQDDTSNTLAIIEGELGAINSNVRINLAQKLKEQKEALTKKMQADFRLANLNKGQTRFISATSKLKEKEQTAMSKGERKLTQFSYFRAGQISTLSGGNEFWIQTNQEVAGRSNLNENKLPEGENMLISHLGIEYGYDATGTITDPAFIQYENFVQAPVGLMNGYLRLYIGSRLVINELLIGPNFFAGDTGSVMNEISRAVKYYEVDEDDLLWQSQETIKVEFKFPDGTGIAPFQPAGNHFIRFTIIGSGTRNRS